MNRGRGNKIKIMLLIFVVTIAFVSAGYLYKMQQLEKLQHMSFQQMIEYTTLEEGDAVITVGIIKDGKTSYTVYGKDGRILPQTEELYEIGSLTKTFDGALICKAVGEGKIQLEDTIDKYLELPKKDYYPTIKDLVTHTSGYKSFYLESEMIKNHLSGRNDMYGISKEKLWNRISKTNLKEEEHAFCYSNFGMAVIGMVLENVYGQDYTRLMNNYVQDELNLKHTSVSMGKDHGRNFWDWKSGDAYMPAGAMISNISDMLAYAQMQMDETPKYLGMGHQIIKEINVNNYLYTKMGLHADRIGVNWMYDRTNEVYWHSGDTTNYSSYLCFNPQKETAVVILSNQKPSDKIPAAVMGIRLYQEIMSQ